MAWRTVSIAAATFALVAGARAGAWEDLDALERRVEAFVGAAVGEGGGPARPIDRRLRLGACAEGAAVAWLDERRRSVVVRCAAPAWRIHVGVHGSQVAGAPERGSVQSQPVLTLARAVPKGATLTAEDVVLGTPSARFADALSAPEQAVGRVARRPLAAGSTLRAGALAAPLLVRRGDPVPVRYASAAFSIGVEGVAEENGAAGATIRVRNAATGRTVRGRVLDTGEIAVGPLNFPAPGRSN